MNRSVLFAALAACGGGGGGMAAGPDASGSGSPDSSVSVDAPPAMHTGGWRMAGKDTSRTYRSDGIGPNALANATVLADNTVTDSSLGAPVVDEDGNLYLSWFTPQQPQALVSLDPTGHERWRTPIDTGWSLYTLTLAPDGNVYSVASMYTNMQTYSKLVGFDAKTGAPLTGMPAVDGVAALLVAADGGQFAMTYTEAAGYGTVALDKHHAMKWKLDRGGDAYALSPAGDTLAIMTVPKTMGAPIELVALDPTNAQEKWHYTFAAGLGTPQLAIDTDGTIYAAVSQNGSHLHVMRFSPTGQPLWDSDVAGMTWPSRILIGSQHVVIAAQSAQNFAGIGLQKSDGNTPADQQLTCGEPQAIDSQDTVFWSCDNGQQATTPSGAFIASWPGRFSFQIVLGGHGDAYAVPAAYFAAHQLFRIK